MYRLRCGGSWSHSGEFLLYLIVDRCGWLSSVGLNQLVLHLRDAVRCVRAISQVCFDWEVGSRHGEFIGLSA